MRYETTYIYYTLLILCCAHAFARGAAPERIGAAILGIGSLLSRALVSVASHRFQSVEYGIVVVDVPVFIAYAALAARAERFWPIWAASLVGVGMLGHFGRWSAGTDISRWVYAVSITIWSYAIIGVIAIGTFCHQRRVARFGFDRSWTPLVGPRPASEATR
jgi:hypothetical protein